MNEAQQRTLSLDYFRLGLACPFLEEEACSIYADRPLGCREYLVTSPAEACSRLDFAALQTVPLPTEVGSAVRVVNQQTTAAEQSWVPLVLALEWAADHPAEPPLPGPVWLEKVFSRLARKPV
ncbi:MAG TPA: YkgJ family cysteine cluster protein, partial [Candidatus Sumerlaeota bacterium]|nr:YkgJ family cysteine cluster protein [Candidatus Sumerlaeota bacterium]